MPRILGIESTCDETAAAVVENGRRVLSSVIASQAKLHEIYRGVVPEIASRAHIENILPVIREALAGKHVSLEDIDAIAVAHRPGLIGSLLVGVAAAKALAWSLGKPLIGIDHVHAHLYSVMLDNDFDPQMPAVGLVASGGHTAMYRIKSWHDLKLIGTTIDDAVGEAYDKVAAILGLEYPGGPVVDRRAAKGASTSTRFPRSMLGRESLDFSFSGLKTSVLYHVRGIPGREDESHFDKSDRAIDDVCAAFQAACVETIIKKLRRAMRVTSARSIIIGGGVSANTELRKAMRDFDVPVFFPDLKYCTDNAAMISGLANIDFERGEFSRLDLDAITSSQFSV